MNHAATLEELLPPVAAHDEDTDYPMKAATISALFIIRHKDGRCEVITAQDRIQDDTDKSTALVNVAMKAAEKVNPKPKGHD